MLMYVHFLSKRHYIALRIKIVLNMLDQLCFTTLYTITFIPAWNGELQAI